MQTDSVLRPLVELSAQAAAAIQVVLTDVDGTLTADERLEPEAFVALWELRRAGLGVVVVTGRPAGWCDLIARQWPVDGVVGENGALAFFRDDEGRMQRRYHPAAVRDRAPLERLRDVILSEVPGSRVAPDQPFRMFDLAIDFCEEPPNLGLDAAQKIRAVFEHHGAHAKISNIHVNGWLGDYDKLSMVRLFVQERFGLSVDASPDRFIYCGDSPNDEPMFAHFPNACAVANIAPFVNDLRALPRFLANAAGGKGFAEVIAALLKLRGRGS
jgi:hypothetical protein